MREPVSYFSNAQHQCQVSERERDQGDRKQESVVAGNRLFIPHRRPKLNDSIGTRPHLVQAPVAAMQLVEHRKQ